MPQIKTFSQQQSRDRILQTIKSGLQQQGVSNPNVGEGSHFYLMSNAIAEQYVTAQDQNLYNFKKTDPTQATGSNLDAECNIYGLFRRPESQAIGFITVVISVTSVTIPANTELISKKTGAVYQTLSNKTVSSSDLTLQIVAKQTGVNGNLDVGETLVFTSPPVYVDTQAVVFSAITGGSDVENDTSLQNRLQEYLANPPTSGNVGDIIQKVKEVSPIIQDVYVYPCINGPASCTVAVGQSPDNLISKLREITDTSLINSITSTLQNKLPLYAEYYVVSISSEYVTLLMSMSAGFKDKIPFPTQFANVVNTDISNLTQGCTVVSMVSNIDFNIKSTYDISKYASYITIGYVNTNNYTYFESRARVVSSTLTGSSPNKYYEVRLQLDQALSGLTTFQTIFPALNNGQKIVNSILNYVTKLAPAEKTSNKYVLNRAKRQPFTITSTIDNRLCKSITDNNIDVLDVDIISPTIPYVPTVNPNILLAPKYSHINTLGLYSNLIDYQY